MKLFLQPLINVPKVRLPILELTFIIVGLFGRLSANSSDDFFGSSLWFAYEAGWIGLFVGFPLYFVSVRIFWFDISYILISVVVIAYFKSQPAEPIFFLGYLAVVSPGFLLAGVSFSMRRGVAYYMQNGELN